MKGFRIIIKIRKNWKGSARAPPGSLLSLSLRGASSRSRSYAGPSSVGLALYLSTVVSGVSSLSQLQVWARPRGGGANGREVYGGVVFWRQLGGIWLTLSREAGNSLRKGAGLTR